MKNRRDVKKANVVLDGICAVLWIARTIIGIATKEYQENTVFFILNAACAVLWIAAFIRWLMVYRDTRDEEKQGTAIIDQ